MNNESNKNRIIIGVLILIIAILIIMLIYVTTNVINLKKEVNSLENLPNSVVDNNTEYNLDYIHTKNANVLLSSAPDNKDNNKYAELSIADNGNLIVRENSALNDQSKTKTFSINGEKIKYLHYDYYQSGETNVIFYLTESGNLYVNEFICDDILTIDIINNFKKMDYSNVKELVKIKNANYLMENEGMTDYKKFYIYALISNDLVKIANQYCI